MAKKAATVAERAHMGRVAALGCIICGMPAQCHHINAKGMGMRSSNFEVIPLCANHHTDGGHGVAIHAGKKTWESKYGLESELLAKTRELVA